MRGCQKLRGEITAQKEITAADCPYQNQKEDEE